MAVKNKLQISTQRKAPRRCSVCGKTGHNTRTCVGIQAPKHASTKARQNSSHIVVHVVDKVRFSPHVVELGKKQETKHWEGIRVYNLEKQVKQERGVLDFAKMVREANVQTLQHQNTSAPKQFITRPRKKTSSVKRVEFRKIRQSLNIQRHILNLGSYLRDGSMQPVYAMQNKFRKLQENFSIKRFALSAMIFLLIISVPFPAVGFYRKVQKDTTQIVSESTNAFLSLQSSTLAALQNNIPQAEYDLNSALNSFGNAQELIDKEYKAMVYVASTLPVVGTKIKSRQHLLLAGHHLALGNTYLVKGIDEATHGEDLNLIDSLGVLKAHMASSLPQYEDALTELGNVGAESLPVDYQSSFDEFKTLFAAFINDMRDIVYVMDGIQILLGGDGFRRYLVVFQNQHELRATGGFAGSFAIVDVQNGKILNIDLPAGGTYDVQGQLDVYVKPPLPLQLVDQRWEFHDSNWFSDFAVASEKMSWFYRHSRNVTVDGVVAVNASVLERILRVLGPVYNEDYDLLFDADNVLSDIQYEVETKEEGEDNTKPKEILSLLLDQLLDSLGELKPAQLMGLVTELNDALQEKEIQVYFEDDGLQRKFNEFGWTGEIKETSPGQDYLMVVNSNIGGGKSDALIESNVEHEALVLDDGSVIDTVTITRTHTGKGDETFYGLPNIDYVRLYVPEGSELLDAGGFIYPPEDAFKVPPSWYEEDTDLAVQERGETFHVGSGTRITQEFGKTAFGNWIITYPTETTEIFFVYKLPFKIFEDGEQMTTAGANRMDEVIGLLTSQGTDSETSRYSLLVQKQSGFDSSLSHTIIYPNSWRPVWKIGDDIHVSVNGAQVSTKFDTDKVFGIVMKQDVDGK